MTGKLSFLGSDVGSGWLNSYKANQAEIRATVNLVNELKASFDGVAISQEMANKVSASTNIALKALVNDFTAGKITSTEFAAGLNGLSSSLRTAEIRAAALKTGVKNLGIAMANIAVSMAAVWAVTSVISLVVKGIDELVHREEKIKESSEEAKTAIGDLRNELDNLQSTTKDIGKDFAKLAQGVENLGKANQSRGKLSTDDYATFLDLSNQLAELYPTLTRGYDENGNAILNLSGDVNTIIGSLENLLEVQQKIANQSIVDKIPDIWAGYKIDFDKYSKAYDNYEAVVSSYLKTLDMLSSSEKKFTVTDSSMHSKIIAAARNIGLDNGALFGNSLSALYSEHKVNLDHGEGKFKSAKWDLSSLSDEKIEQLKNELGKLASEYQSAANSTKNKIQAANAEMSGYINTWLSNEWNFVKLEKPMQNALREVLLNGDWVNRLPNNIDTGDWSEVSNWLSQNFLYAARNIDSDEIQESIADAVEGTLSVDALQELIDKLKEIDGFDEDNPLLIYLQTKLDVKTDLINGVKARLKEEYRNKVIELSDNDLQIAANLEIPYDTLLSWDELLRKIQNFKDGKRVIRDFTEELEDLSDVIDEVVSKQKKLADVFQKVSSGAKLAAEEVYELLKEFPELYKYLELVDGKYTVSSEGIKAMNQESVAKLQETLKKDIEDKSADINDLKSLYDMAKKLNAEINPSDDSLKEYQELYARTQSLRDKYNITSSTGLEYGFLDNNTDKQFSAALDRLQDDLDGFKALAEIAGEVFDEKALAIAGIQEGFKTAKDEIVDYNKDIQAIDSAIKSLKDNASLTYDEMNELVAIAPDLQFEEDPNDSGKFTIAIEALEELKDKSYETRNSYIDDRLAETQAELDAAEATKESLAEKMEYFDKYAEFTAQALSGFASKLDVQEQIDIASAQTEELKKVVEMLKALRKDLTFDTDSSNALDNEIDYYKTITSDVEIMRDKYKDALDKEIDDLEDAKKALKNANDERQRELDLIEARNNLENAKKRKVWVYSKESGFQQVADEGAIKKAEGEYRDAITDIQAAEIDKEIELREKQKEALDENTKALTELEKDIQDALTVEQAKSALGITDETDLLNLLPDVQAEIKEGFTNTLVEKANKENEGTKFQSISFEDVLKSMGITASPDIIKDMVRDTMDTVQSKAKNAIVNGLKDQADAAVTNVVNNNNNTVNNPVININGTSNPERMEQVARKVLHDVLVKARNSTI
ncbi:MAG: hypothetical protein HDT43_01880 [Ruminococcaceae bacterium]|nr:hypothetical protein [Oscillospiraceae bacterium]